MIEISKLSNIKFETQLNASTSNEKNNVSYFCTQLYGYLLNKSDLLKQI